MSSMVGETLLVTNDKYIAFLQLWRGNQRLAVESIEGILNHRVAVEASPQLRR